MKINCFKSYYNVNSALEYFYQPTGVVKTDVVWELWTLSFLLSTKRLLFIFFSATFLFYQVYAQACVCYLHQGGYIFLHVRLFSRSVGWLVSRISLKTTEQFFHHTWMEDGFWPRIDHNHCADSDKETDPGIKKKKKVLLYITRWEASTTQ